MSDEILTNEELWKLWIIKIAKDPEMSVERTLQHIQKHIINHMPNVDAPKERFEEWLGGAYNLLAILGSIKGIKVPHEIGISLLFNKWLREPTGHTPPPIKKDDIWNKGGNS